jgi:hypothetical protein
MVVFFTDLDGSFPEETSLYPVLWASTGSSRLPSDKSSPP